MIVSIWLTGLIARRSGRLLGAALGVALAVALLVALGSFTAASSATMTRRAASAVPVDWQVLLAPGADPQAVAEAARAAAPATALEPVGYAQVAGLSATTGGTVQTTGPGVVLGLGPHYRTAFPAEFRPLLGGLDGVLVAQQTAANLHVTVGDTVTIARTGLPSASVVVAGVVDLPYADSLFQTVGVPPGTAPQAPPDNVLLLPAAKWHALFDPLGAVRSESVRTQLHLRLDRALPPDPGDAFALTQQRTRNLEARIAGSGVVGDNLAATLEGARADALYARVLFLFLGLPGALLAGVLTMAIAGSGAARRRQEQALLRVRGASTAQILRLALLEALVVAIGGVLVGTGLGSAAAAALVPGGGVWTTQAWLWVGTTAALGMALALVAVVLPAWVQTRHVRVVAARRAVGPTSAPLWERLYLDAFMLAVAGAMFWRTASTGYQLVLAPEGVATASVAYEAFLAPLGLWLGLALLALRLGRVGLLHGRRVLTVLLQPLAGVLAETVAAALGRQHTRLARGMALVALAVAFAVSIAIFNTTYTAQARVDAELTNGADVLVRGTSAIPAGAQQTTLAALSGVASAEAMLHRFAYVGSDLQDLYGIDPLSITRATHLANAYFANGDAAGTLAVLAAQLDGVLVSEETMQDFQLQVGDHLNLRLQHAGDNQYRVVPFTFIGVVREFPTAPKDSFLVANASYIAQQTGRNAAEYMLLQTSSAPATVAEQARQVVKGLPGVQVSDIGTAQRAIDSGLTAVDLRGLTALELAFAVLLVASATGLVLALGLAERRRTFAILAALGARTSQLGAFVWSEGLLVVVVGSLLGGLGGVALAQVLVTMLTHVFDPPPEALSAPWFYLALLVGAAAVATVLAVASALATARRPAAAALREA